MTRNRHIFRSPGARTRAVGFALGLAVLAVLSVQALHAAPVPQQTPARVVAIGDIHGDFDSFVNILRHAGLIDERLAWSGGAATLVQTGDFTDRGPRVRQVMDLLMSLERQAPLAGGRVVVLLGNHEVMNLLGEFRDVAPAAYDAFADERSDERRARAYRAYASFMAARAAALSVALPVQDEAAWLRSHPPGFVEYAEAFGADGVYGRWLRSKAIVETLGDTAFLHAGLNPDTAPPSLEDVNRRVREEIDRFDSYRRYLIDSRVILPFFTLAEMRDAVLAESRVARDPAALAEGVEDRERRAVLSGVLRMGTWDILRPDGPLWFRGFATWSSGEGATRIRDLRERYRIAHWVVGHTVPASMRITPRFGSSVFLIDTGMLSAHYPGGRPSALEIRNGRFTAISPDQSTTLLAPEEPQAASQAAGR